MIHLYSAERAEDLAGKLAQILIDDPLDPMEPEWMAVPSDGMRRWLNLELARHLGATRPGGGDGVAANFQRAYPGTLRTVVLDAAYRIDAGPSPETPGIDPWQIDQMVWSLLPVFDDLAANGDMPEFTELPDGASRFTRVRAVADLFDRYHLHRPEMIRAWADPGRPDGGMVDGATQPISDNSAWQPRLWRLLRDEVGAVSPPERMGSVLDLIRGGRLDLDDDLPSRLVLFGFTSLPGRDFLPLVEAVADLRAVHLFLLEPHRFDLAQLLATWPNPMAGARRIRSEDPTGIAVRQPLLRSWGRLPRESALILADALAPNFERLSWVPTSVSRRSSLLERLQADIREDAEASASPVAPDDRSVQFHACFGPMRQVQVVRDAILHLLNDPSSGLTEEDVLVVCPGLEKFAPLVEAVFGPSGGSMDVGDGGGPPPLRFRIADRSIRSSNPVIGATTSLLELVAGRFELAQVLDFISLAPVRERFGLDDADLSVIAEWATDARVRWGLDPGHRSGFGIPASVAGNTWQAALDRLLVGSAVTDVELDLAIGDVAPFGVDSGDVEVLGTLAFILGRLANFAGLAARTDLAITDWVDALRRTCGDLLAAPEQSSWQFKSLERVLRETVEAATSSRRGAASELDLLDVRRLLEGRLDSEPGRPDFFRGGVTVTSMASLRWVPFRVVCVLGLDQDSLGSSAPDAADLVAASPQVGDPDQRSETRQWLLEAVLAAGDHLVIVRNGRDIRSNHSMPRVIPAAELFDAVIALIPVDDQAAARESFEVVHPRHPFDEKCLIPDSLISDVSWSFATRDREGAERRRNRSRERASFLEEPLDIEAEQVVELADLHQFLRDPVATFVRRSLEANLPRPANEVDDILPVDPDGLEVYRIGSDLLDARLHSTDEGAWRRFERAKGTLPPGVLEDRLFDNVSTEIAAILAEASARGVQLGDPLIHHVDVVLPGGARIVGTIPLGLDMAAPGPGRVQFTRPKDTHRLEAWLDLMILVASDPAVRWRSVVVTRAKSKGAGLKPVELVPAASDDPGAMALDALALIVDLYRRGLCEPLPLFSGYSPAVHNGSSADDAWTDNQGRGDANRPAVRLVFGDVDVDEIDDVTRKEGDPDVPGNRVELYARHLWGAVDRTSERVL